jgi:hypothetical protein
VQLAASADPCWCAQAIWWCRGSARPSIARSALASNLWLFGGVGYDSTGDLGYLNDLWQYNPRTELTWINGSEVPESA